MPNDYRLGLIISLLRKGGKATIPELAKELQVTEATIRRDLLVLEEDRQIIRRRGYAEINRNSSSEGSTRTLFLDEKKRMASAAIEFVKPRKDYQTTSLALDDGSSVAVFLDLLLGDKSLNPLYYDAVTISLDIALKTHSHLRTVLPGGMLHHHVLTGLGVPEFLEGVQADYAFLGTTGLLNTSGLTCSNPEMLNAKAALAKCATVKIGLADSSKFSYRGMYTFCPFEKLDYLITVRTSENADQLAHIAEKGCKIILV